MDKTAKLILWICGLGALSFVALSLPGILHKECVVSHGIKCAKEARK